jgi:hypothetical protein
VHTVSSIPCDDTSEAHKHTKHSTDLWQEVIAGEWQISNTNKAEQMKNDSLLSEAQLRQKNAKDKEIKTTLEQRVGRGMAYRLTDRQRTKKTHYKQQMR